MDLSLIPIMDLFEEIDRRFDTVVILTCKERSDNDVFECHKKGSHVTAVGLCEQYVFALKNEKKLEEIDEFDKD